MTQSRMTWGDGPLRTPSEDRDEISHLERPFPGRGPQMVSEDRELRDNIPSSISLVSVCSV